MDERARDYDVEPPTSGDLTSWRADRSACNGWEHGSVQRAAAYDIAPFNTAECDESHDCFGIVCSGGANSFGQIERENRHG